MTPAPRLARNESPAVVRQCSNSARSDRSAAGHTSGKCPQPHLRLLVLEKNIVSAPNSYKWDEITPATKVVLFMVLCQRHCRIETTFLHVAEANPLMTQAHFLDWGLVQPDKNFFWGVPILSFNDHNLFIEL
jgi:hypothetical protein